MADYRYSEMPEVVAQEDHGGIEVALHHEKYLHNDPSTTAPEPIPYDPHMGTSAEKYVIGGPRDGDENDLTQEPLYRRRFGRLKVYVWALLALLLVVIVIVIAVPVAVTKNKHSSPTPQQSLPQSFGAQAAFNQTGMANVNSPSTGSPITYIQATNGSIMEYFWSSDDFNQSSWTPINASVVATNAKPGFPIAAVSYMLTQGFERRHVFYFSDTGELTDLIYENVPGTPGWAPGLLSASFTGASNTAFRWLNSSTNNVGLAACVQPYQYANTTTIRIFVGAELLDGSGSYVQEIGTQNAESGSSLLWTTWERFTDADATAGLACTTYHGYLNLYYLNTTSNQIQQDIAVYNTSTNSSNAVEVWGHNNFTYAGPAPIPNTPIAAGPSGGANDMVMYQTSNIAVRNLQINNVADPAVLSTYNDINIPYLDAGSKFAAQLVTNTSSLPVEVVLYYQSASHEIVAVSAAVAYGLPDTINATLNIASA